MVEIPAEKIRQDAALAILAYNWGRPVERQSARTVTLRIFASSLIVLTIQRLTNCSNGNNRKHEIAREVTGGRHISCGATRTDVVQL
jgi:hypothetical protein